MGKRKVNPLDKRAAIARVKAGATSYGEEGKRLGLAKSTLHEAGKQIDPNAPPAGPGKGDTPLEAARKAVGTAPPGPKTPLTPEELKQATPQTIAMQGEYCVATLNEMKTIVVLGTALLRKIPVLEEKRLTPLMKIGEMAEGSARAAAPELEPLLKKYLPEGSAIAGLCVVMLFDLAGTWQALSELADEHREKREAAAKAKAEAQKKAPAA